jgi:hypothetical protein
MAGDTPTESSDFKEGCRVRVWWPPTADSEKTDYAGM